MWRVGIAWSPSYVDETSQARLPFRRRGAYTRLSPKRTFDDSNNAEEQARQDETAVHANHHLAALHVRRPRDELVFQVPVAHDGLFPALGRFNLQIKADPSVLPHPPLSLAIAEAA
ncbi:hypothetical protein LA080_002737 [Diaporthe eres]|nr:hypothetical protein LA080_002737 [Diaporthe eres]